MKRSVVLFLTGLTLLSSVADAGRRSGGGFGGSRSSGSSYSRSSGSSYRSSPSRSSNYGSNSYGNSYGGSSYSRPSSTSSGSSWNFPSRSSNPYPGSTSSGSRTAGSSSSSPRSNPTPKTSYPSNAAVKSNPLNTAAAARVTPTQLSQWNKLQLPVGVDRSALTYSAAPSAQYRYQLQPGRYYPYPQSYYRQHNIGYDLLKYALIFTAVTSIADAMTPDVVVANPGYGSSYSNGNYPSYAPNTVVVQQRGPGLGTYLLVGLFAALAGWFLLGRRRRGG